MKGNTHCLPLLDVQFLQVGPSVVVVVAVVVVVGVVVVVAGVVVAVDVVLATVVVVAFVGLSVVATE